MVIAKRTEECGARHSCGAQMFEFVNPRHPVPLFSRHTWGFFMGDAIIRSG
jgi:hypothetical protein